MKQACSLLLAVSAGLAGGSQSAWSVDSVPGEMHYAGQVPEAIPTAWRNPDRAKSPLPALTLLPLAAERITSVQAYNQAPGVKAQQIGIDRPVRSETAHSPLADGLDWQAVPGGRAAQIEVVSPDAEALRVALTLEGLPDDAEIRVAGNAFPDTIYADTVANARTLLDGSGRFWTAVTDGERQRLELFVPAASGADVAAAISPVTTVAHLLVPMNGSADMTKALGDSGSCNINVACRSHLGEAFRVTKNAVAHMVFQEGGGSYICTGTMLNDADESTQKKWFYSAHHCIGTQTVANTLSTFWHYEAPSCGAYSAGPNRQMTGGAALRWNSAGTDAALLELNGNLPSGVEIGFAGWSANPIASGAAVAAIHHPRGDNKKYSRGSFQGTQSVTISGQTVANANIVSWSEGTTEGGSSGSGLFTWDASSYYLRGGLFGGGASCANSGTSSGSNYDAYSRFDLVYPGIQQYLNPAGSGGSTSMPTRDHSGAWYVPSESGWGLLLQQYGVNSQEAVLFATWFTFDQQGRRAWYQLLPAWTGTNVASGRVNRPSGPAWSTSFDPNRVTFADAGSFTLNFTSATQATFTFQVDGVQRTVTLHKL